MDNKELFTIFRNHTHTGAYPDAKKLPPWALGIRTEHGLGLLSPNGTRYLLGIDNDGVFTVTSVPYSNLLISPDGTTWAVGISAEGALESSPAKTPLRGVMFYDSIPLVDSVGGRWQLGVDNDGALTSTPAS